MSGPFDGRHVGTVRVPVRIRDLSAGGCLIESRGLAAVGGRLRLQIDLPGEGWIAVEAETLAVREDYGCAVKFVSVDEANQRRIERTTARVLDRSPEGWSFDAE
jgi:hypothetical protein